MVSKLRSSTFVLCLIAFFGLASFAQAQNKNLAPGFNALPKAAKVVLIPIDAELFSISAGGVAEPKADWTKAASGYMRTALLAKKRAIGLEASEMSEADSDQFAEISSLHAAVAQSISIHHFGPIGLPTKEGKLDWSLGDAVKPIKEKTGADYALFIWMRDSYASPERKAMMVVLAFAGVGLTGGIQQGYASLIDLNDGKIVWFNRLISSTGDLREAKAAESSIDSLLKNFPAIK